MIQGKPLAWLHHASAKTRTEISREPQALYTAPPPPPSPPSSLPARLTNPSSRHRTSKLPAEHSQTAIAASKMTISTDMTAPEALEWLNLPAGGQQLTEEQVRASRIREIERSRDRREGSSCSLIM